MRLYAKYELLLKVDKNVAKWQISGNSRELELRAEILGIVSVNYVIKYSEILKFVFAELKWNYAASRFSPCWYLAAQIVVHEGLNFSSISMGG